MELFFDCETSGFINKNMSATDSGQAWIMQFACILSDKNRIYNEFSTLVVAGKRTCHPKAEAIHGISVEECNKGGLNEGQLYHILANNFFTADTLVAHNIDFDLLFVDHLIQRVHKKWNGLYEKSKFCTMKETTELCQLPGKFGKFKWPKLTELYKFLFGEELEGAHDALIDVRATRRCYYRLKEAL